MLDYVVDRARCKSAGGEDAGTRVTAAEIRSREDVDSSTWSDRHTVDDDLKRTFMNMTATKRTDSYEDTDDSHDSENRRQPC